MEAGRRMFFYRSYLYLAMVAPRQLQRFSVIRAAG
jgi:hypothetical protein